MNGKFDRAVVKSLLKACENTGWTSYQIRGIGNVDSERYVRDLLEFCGLRGFHNKKEMAGYEAYDWGAKMEANKSLMNELKTLSGRPDFVVVDRDNEIQPFFIEVKCGSDDLNPRQRAWITAHKKFPVIILYLTR